MLFAIAIILLAAYFAGPTWFLVAGIGSIVTIILTVVMLGTGMRQVEEKHGELI